MSQPTKLTDAEFSEIKLLQGKFQEITIKLGTLQIEKMNLDQMVNEFVEKEKRLKEEWLSLKKLDQSLHDRIVDTYGEGGINMTDGTFISSAKMVIEEQRKI
jgi:predicted nuclease with TOPRIM domain